MNLLQGGFVWHNGFNYWLSCWIFRIIILHTYCWDSVLLATIGRPHSTPGLPSAWMPQLTVPSGREKYDACINASKSSTPNFPEGIIPGQGPLSNVWCLQKVNMPLPSVRTYIPVVHIKRQNVPTYFLLSTHMFLPTHTQTCTHARSHYVHFTHACTHAQRKGDWCGNQ